MRGYLALAGVIALALLGWAIYERGYSAADKDWQTRWDALAAKHMEENFQAQVRMREKEQEWQRLFDEVSKDAIDKINALESDLAAAAASADGLRDEARDYANRARRCSENTGAADERETAQNPDMVLADLLESVERDGRRMAEEADRRGIAGKACEDAYLSIKKPSQGGQAR